MLTNRGAIARLLVPDLHKVYVSIGKTRPLEYKGLINEGPMPWNPMTDQQMFGLGPMGTKAEGAVYTLETLYAGSRVTYTAQPFGMALEFTKEAWRDELYGYLKEMVGEMSTSVMHRKNVQGFAPINDAFAGATYVGFDGSPLCSATHGSVTAEPDGTTKSNRPAPDVGFSITGVQAAILAYHRVRTGRNMPRVIHLTRFILDAFNLIAAREILGSSGKPYTADNEVNAIIPEELSYHIVHYLANQAHWHAISNPGNHDVWLHIRDDSEFDAFDDPWTDNAIFTSYLRTAEGFGEWRGWYGSTG